MRYFKLGYDFSVEATTLRCEECDKVGRRYHVLDDFTGKEMYEWLDEHVRRYHEGGDK